MPVGSTTPGPPGPSPPEPPAPAPAPSSRPGPPGPQPPAPPPGPGTAGVAGPEDATPAGARRAGGSAGMSSPAGDALAPGRPRAAAGRASLAETATTHPQPHKDTGQRGGKTNKTDLGSCDNRTEGAIASLTQPRNRTGGPVP
ncbi:hypothetical protein GCM10010507_22430 [Streptomyces cinnamoneus]|uniref:Uncharacterized protein n=1 Tax=Streptomyces cinnamoneus TaxID=53446 RepID=A0A918THQ3_STRCJ|nr:hypothetical protein GCM10010507_22430 [Streptomyces cinnamoneus]